MKLRDALRVAAEKLAAAGVESPRREARLLAGLVLPAGSTPLDGAAEIDEAVFGALVARRVAREPFALLAGRQGFWTLDLAVSGETLVPRADSETLLDAALACFADRAVVRRVLDLGTGTGCLLLAALSEFPAAFGVGVDLAPAAALLAAGNAARVGLAARCGFLAGDWAAALVGPFDLILCNPPYIPSGEIAGLMPEVRAFEPRRALDGGADGLREYARLLPQIARLLAPEGAAILEFGAGQAGSVAALARAAGLAHMTVARDLAGLERALIARAGGMRGGD